MLPTIDRPPPHGSDDPAPTAAGPGGGHGHALALDGLRGLAVALVLLYHGDLSWLPGGFLGVSLFFTLSGFLITSLLLTEWGDHGRIALRSFWTRRVRRLLPASLVGIALAAAYVALAAPLSAKQHFRGDGIAGLLDVANWRLIVDGQSYQQLFAAPSPLQHFWSLAVEEQVYLVLPVVVIATLAAARGRRWLLGVTASALLAASVALPHVLALSDDRFYFGTDTRAAEILVGVLLAVVLARRNDDRRSPFTRTNPPFVAGAGLVALGLVLVACTRTAQGDRWIHQGGLAAFAVLGAGVIVAALDDRSAVARLLGVGPLVALGRISFGVYVYHWPIMLWLRPPPGQGWSPARLGAAWGLTLAAAIVSNRFVEQPWRRHRGIGRVRLRRIAPTAVVLVALLVVATTATVPAANAAFDMADGTLVTDRNALGAPPDPRPVGTVPHAAPVAGPVAAGFHLDPPPIHRPDRPLRLLVVGDSTAVALNGTLSAWGTSAGVWTSTSYARIGCGIGRGGIRARFTWEQPVPDECDHWAQEWPRDLAAIQPDLIVVSSSFWDATDRKLPGEDVWRAPGDPRYDEFLRREYATAVDVLSSTGAAIIWVDNPPVHFGYDTPDPSLFGVNEPARMQRLNDLLGDLAADHPQLQVVPLTRYLESRPAGVFDPELRPDGLHLDGPRSAEAGAWLGPTILDAFWRTRAAH